MPEENLKQKTKKGIYWTFLNQGANQVITFIVGIIMARILSPEDYGITALPAVFLAVAGIFMNAGFSQALVRKPEVTDKDLSTAFYYSIAMGVVMYVVLFFSAPLIARFYKTPILTPLIRVTTLTFLWGPLNTPQSVILQRRLDFKTPARIAITTNVIGAIVGITAAYNGLGLWALVITNIVSSLLGLIQTWLAVRWVPTTRWNKESFQYLWGYGNKIIGANLIDTIYNNITPIFVGKFYSSRDLGVYNRALGYTVLPANQITNVLSSVTLPVLSKFQDNDEVLVAQFRRMFRMASFISFPVLMLLCALAKPLIHVLITDKWAECIILLQIMCFAKMWWPIQTLNRNLLQVKGRSDLLLKLEAYKKTINLVILCCSLPFGIKWFCYAQILQTMQSYAWNTYYTGKLFNLTTFKQLADVMPSFILSIIMLFCVFGVNMLIGNSYIQIIIGGLVGVGVYLGGAILLKREELNDVRYMLKIKK